MSNIFFSYAPEDAEFVKNMGKQFAALRRTGKIAIIDVYDAANTQTIDDADIIVLFISADYISNDQVYNEQVVRAIQRHDSGEARVIPVMLRATDISGMPFERLNKLPAPNGMKPVDDPTWGSQDVPMTSIVKDIQKVITTFVPKPRQPRTDTPKTDNVINIAPKPNPVVEVPKPDNKPNVRSRTILLCAANPSDSSAPLKLMAEIRKVEQGLERSKFRDHLNLVDKLAVTPQDFQRAVQDLLPAIIHFSGHGMGSEGLVFENEFNRSKIVSTPALAALFALFKENIECVFLNACYAEEQAKAIVEHIPYVIGMNNAVPDDAAIAFSVGFYDALGAGMDYEKAFESGKVAIMMAGIEGELIPVLMKKGA